MRRRLLKCHSQVSIWVHVNIDAAFMVWAHTVFHTNNSRPRDPPSQQIHRVQTSESSPMFGGDQAHSSGSYAGKILGCPVLLGSSPKTERFGLGLTGYLGLLKKPSPTLKGSEKPLFPDVVSQYMYFTIFISLFA